ncbi:uncharacterized protein LOC133824492 [Humulus lupulus]|uniref:uncharacterized protein LOC133824492 n=1 Tax=Humulus lupulus TaxID=3486 RepID=UPI002B408210|nr:uncharacterized protein LOC133824492 [Humulus lupulus]
MGPKILDFMKQKLPNWDFYTSLVTEGRLLIVWRKVFVKVTILEDSPQFVHCLVSMVGQKHMFYITFVYGFNSLEGRRSLWEGLLRISLAHDAWIILGDFNAPFSVMDRAGGSPISGVELVDSVRWLEEAHMVPIKSLGSFSTWTNNQNGSARIYSKIDHDFINENWFDLFPYATAVFKWEVVSDHCSCIVNIQSKVSLGTKLLRFYNIWTDHPQFFEVVRFSWQLPIHTTGLRAVFLKSLRLKHSLKKFNHNTFGDIGLSFDMAKEKYQEAQLKAQAFPTEYSYQESVKEAAEAYIVQEKMFYSFLSQRSQLVDNFPEVVSHFVEHFRGYLGSQSSASSNINMAYIDLGPKLSIDHQTLLLKPFSSKEIRRALFGIPSNKSPGPDGYGSGFFKAAWQIVGKEAVTSPRCAIKIDLSKAYDKVDWQFLEDLLKALCFPMKFIGWIMMCLRNTSYSLLMNGRVQGALDPSFRFHPMCKSLKLINLCFADDLILFCKGTHSAVFSLKIALDDFNSATGLTINSAKSQIFFGGVSSTMRNINSQEMNLMEGSFPLKYLGVPMRPTKWRHEDCDIILQKIRLRLNSWSSRHLSYAGRMQLIHSVLFGLRNYWMSIFILPQSVVKEIEKLCRSFLWGSAGLRSKPHLASWKKVCLPKAYGGLGFRDGALWNRAILAKYIWVLSEQPEILWVKWVNSIYLKGCNFWCYILKSDCS